MWEVGETVLAQGVAAYRKRPGTLYFTNRRLAWVPDGGLAPTVSVKHDEIRGMQASSRLTKAVACISLPETENDHLCGFY